MKHYCVIGFPIKHSLSPKIHNCAFKKLKIPARYEAIEIKPENLAQFMRGFRKKYVGANVTIPHKETVIRFLDKLSPEARAIGAVNTIVNKNGKLIGYNTDIFGAMSALRSRRVRLKNKNAVVLGAGGASRAVCFGLKRAGARLTILNRTLEKAENLAREFKCACGKLEDFGNFECDLLVNTTSVGMWKGKFKIKNSKVVDTPLPQLVKVLKAAEKKPIVMDIVYRPRMTKLLRDAKKASCRIITGNKMFVAQAAQSFKLWTGREFTVLKTLIP